jgi:multicomponent Na+:H+ antiporter subunit A
VTLLLLLHLGLAALGPLVVRAMGRYAFLVLALAPAAAFCWLLAQSSRVAQGGSVVEVVTWVPSLDLDLAFRLTTLQWVLALLVSGIGALVLAYCTWYFDGDAEGLGRFGLNFTGFAGAMLGLVLADDLLLLYVFWELTTVFSYLLIGHQAERRADRRAALQALIVTTAGGLAMLVGLILIGDAAGTYRISEILAAPPTGAAVTAGVVLALVGAVSKSALIPFHFWLPGAMVAPTPVSAYLHAAAMVKAGVYLVALLAPAFADVGPWRPIVLGLGAATMALGGWHALRQTDLKLILAHGTVSQLGFLVAIVGLGTRSAALAGVAMVVAHALFKASLFLVVGIIDRAAGTRDLRELSGLARSMPVVTATGLAAAASMAAIPPVAGFVAKESVFIAFLDVGVTPDGDGTGIGPVPAGIVLAALVAGSALTVAYTARFAWGAFGTKRDVPATEAVAVAAGFVAAPALLSMLSVAVGFAGAAETVLIEPYATAFPPGAHEPDLALWHGLEPALALSAVAVLGGLALFGLRGRVERLQARAVPLLDAGRTYHSLMRGLDRLAVEVTGTTQRGSLPIYLAVVLVVVVVLPGGALVFGGPWEVDLQAWDVPAQAVVGGLVAVAAVLAARARRRLKAVVLVGVTGYGTALLFLLHGAPDLALTQVLVETVTIVVFVLVMRRLPIYFSDRPLTSSRWGRLGIGVLVGTAFAGFVLAATSARTADPVSDDFPAEAVSFGGGKNIVNVILVDIRAWDTLGEISVLAVAATGVASMVFVHTRRGGIARPAAGPMIAARRRATGDDYRNTWLRGGRTLAPERRSIIFEVVVRLAFHTMIAFSLFLLFSGHNNPGGGFAGGLVAGLALMVRYLAAGRYELDEAAPVDAGLVLGLGLVMATGTGLMSLLFGGEVLQSAVIDVTVPLLGEIHLVTSIFFDIGVYLVVVGLMLDVLRSLGSGVDRQAAQNGDEEDEPAAREPEVVGGAG